MISSRASNTPGIYLADEDLVVLLDAAGRPRGAAPRAAVHGARTPLHLAFSCHVVRGDGRMLVTRRALTKRTWPGVWTNAFCGHPMPGEEMQHAIERRAHDELGLVLADVELMLPRFRYRATDASGTVENEVCPVYLATTRQAPRPNPDEVAELAWVRPHDLARSVRSTPWAFSPWLVRQVGRLAALDPEPFATAS